MKATVLRPEGVELLDKAARVRLWKLCVSPPSVRVWRAIVVANKVDGGGRRVVCSAADRTAKCLKSRELDNELLLLRSAWMHENQQQRGEALRTLAQKLGQQEPDLLHEGGMGCHK
jgi:hypothetical protein